MPESLLCTTFVVTWHIILHLGYSAGSHWLPCFFCFLHTISCCPCGNDIANDAFACPLPKYVVIALPPFAPPLTLRLDSRAIT